MTPRRRYAHHALIRESLPLLLSNGLTVTSLTIVCAMCKTRIDQDCMRGEVQGAHGGYRVRMISLCLTCDMYTYASILIEPLVDGWRVTQPATYPLKYPWPEDANSAHRRAAFHPGDKWWVDLMDRVCRVHRPPS